MKGAYYICEQSDEAHDFKVMQVTENGIVYPNAHVCKRCASVFSFGGINVSSVALTGVGLDQYKLKKATEAFQQAFWAKKRRLLITRKRTKTEEAELQETLDTMLTEEDEIKQIPPRSIWRMDSK